MTITITLTTGNADFENDPLGVAAELIVRRIQGSGLQPGPILDGNGNVVGQVSTVGRVEILEDGKTRITRKRWREVVTKVQRHTLYGSRIEAVKLLRSVTNCGLKQALDATRKLG